jgi:putative lipase involved disintegration of autophagic bodies
MMDKNTKMRFIIGMCIVMLCLLFFCIGYYEAVNKEVSKINDKANEFFNKYYCYPKNIDSSQNGLLLNLSMI